MRRLIGAGGWVLGIGLVLAARPALALITAPLPLGQVLNDSPMIVTARVDTLDPARPAAALVVDESLKGKAPFARLAVNLKGDSEAAKSGDTAKLLKRLAPKLPLVLFATKVDRQYTAFAYTNGTWFQLVGVETDDGVRWSFTHCEPYLRKTYKGPTADLKQVIADVLAGKQEPPKPDLKEKPGLGPEVEADKPKEGGSGQKGPENERYRASAFPIGGGPPFAVFPTVLVGGPLALLAMLFPAIFGGLMLVLRRWMAALSVLSINSTLFLAQGWFAGSLVDSWWGTPLALWLTMTGVTLLGLLWAWQRHLEPPPAGRDFEPRPLPAPANPQGVTAAPAFPRPGAGDGPPPPASHRPGLGEVLTLGSASLVLLVVAALWLPRTLARMDLGDKMVWMFGTGLWVATLHSAYRRWVTGLRPSPRRGLPGEGVMLWAMTGAGMAFGATFLPETSGAPPTEEEGPYRVVWRFQPPSEPCWIASSPLVDGDRVYVAAVHPSTFHPGGAVYCVDRASGKLQWTFNNGGKMKQVFSSPCLADGRLYIGEGFHQDQNCKLYCLDAATGKKFWDFETISHTESSPCVSGGKVYFGAGDDGLFCLDADGKEKWHLQGLHVDANPLVVGGRVYGGSGVGDKFQETALFCLDADKGTEVWRMPTPLPVWAMPAFDGGKLFAALGNGNFLDSAEKPAGAVWCLEADTGKRVWQRDVRDGVLGRVAVDAGLVYFGSRDGNCYAADRKEGMIRWQTPMGGPVVASPALAESGSGPAALYAANSDGRVARLDPATGAAAWTFELTDAGQDAVIFSSPAVGTAGGGKGERRRIYFGCGLNTFRRGVLYCLEDRETKAGP